MRTLVSIPLVLKATRFLLPQSDTSSKELSTSGTSVKRLIISYYGGKILLNKIIFTRNISVKLMSSRYQDPYSRINLVERMTSQYILRHHSSIRDLTSPHARGLSENHPNNNNNAVNEEVSITVYPPEDRGCGAPPGRRHRAAPPPAPAPLANWRRSHQLSRYTRLQTETT